MARHLVQQPRSLLTIPVFLAPAFSNARSFSSCPATYDRVQRGNRDKNKKRGVSVIRSTGPRQQLNGLRRGDSLPKPVEDPTEARQSFPADPNHGLWGFFNENKEALLPPGEEDSYGRAWTKTELARKSWQDLHKLHWTCVKEANVVCTRNNERRRIRAGYGETEADGRLKAVKRTMFNIRQVLLERHSATFDAGLLLEERNLYEVFPDLLEENVDPEALRLESNLAGSLVSPDAAPHISTDSDSTSREQFVSVEDQDSRQKLTQ